MTPNDWKIFTGQVSHGDEGDEPTSEINQATVVHLPPDVPINGLPAAPPWRVFGSTSRDQRRGKAFKPSAEAVEMVNAALYLRRPLLVTGKPGTGKSTLAYAVGQELDLGPVLKWPINTRTTLEDGLYRYDAIARLRSAQLAAQSLKRPSNYAGEEPSSEDDRDTADQIGRYIRLGPLGTALLPRTRPRVLLIDEIDKGDIDLPNDLLHVFEEGEFTIAEITRRRVTRPSAPRDSNSEAQGPVRAEVTTDDNQTVTVVDGRVRCDAFPFVILTSNGERDFPPAFLRRCLRLDIIPPSEAELREIVKLHLGDKLYQQSQSLIVSQIKDFVTERDSAKGDLATDQLLNLVYLLTRDISMDKVTEARVIKVLRQKLSSFTT